MTDIEKRLDALQKQAKVFSDCVAKINMNSNFVQVDNMVKSAGKLFDCLKSFCFHGPYDPENSD